MSARHYLVMGNSEEFGEFVSASEAKLGRDMAARAEAAIADDRIAADLRFGHDSGLWPLAGFMEFIKQTIQFPQYPAMNHAWVYNGFQAFVKGEKLPQEETFCKTSQLYEYLRYPLRGLFFQH